MRVLLVAACSLTLSFAASVAINLQKLSMTKEDLKDPNLRRPPQFQPLWCIGMTILILDAIGDFVFIGLAPQSLLAPLGALSLGFNIILAPIFHPKERVTRNIIQSTALIYVGTIMTVLHAAESSPKIDLAALVDFATTPLFLVYALGCICFQGSLYCHGRGKRAFGIVHYTGIAGCFGGETILFAKSASELVKNALVSGRYDDWTSSPLPCLFVICMIGCVLTQVNFLNTGLAKFDALLVVPVYQSFWNAFGITGGLIFFQEYKLMSTSDSWMYALGIGITLVGIAMLIKERRVSDPREDEKHRPGQTDAKASDDVEDDVPTPLRRPTISEEEGMASLRRRTFSEDDGTVRHRRGRHNSEELSALM